MPKRDSCGRNQLFHLEILSLPPTPLCCFHRSDFQTLSQLFTQVSQRDENISLWVLVLCKSDLDVLHETCQCFVVVFKSRRLVLATHKWDRQLKQPLSINFAWISMETRSMNWPDLGSQQTLWFLEQVQIECVRKAFDLSVETKRAKKNQPRIKQRVRLDEIKERKQKINLEAQKCLLQCPLGCLRLNIWEHLTCDDWDGGRKAEEASLTCAGGLGWNGWNNYHQRHEDGVERRLHSTFTPQLRRLAGTELQGCAGLRSASS